jgi:cyclophilin family peptidyl-prolyl cis-trans isomerase
MRSIFSHFGTCFIATACFGLLTLAGCWTSDTAPPTASITRPSYSETPAENPAERRQVDLHPSVLVHTSQGDFTMQLDAEHAPLTVDNFLSYVSAKQYDGTIFHQAYDGFIVLGGGYDAKFVQRPTQPAVRNEAHNHLKNKRGMVAMARQPDSIDSATCQFFVNLADNASLDFAGSAPDQYGYCVFGEVTSGMDVVDRIGKAQVHSTGQFENVPVKPIVIESIRLLSEK